MEQLFQVGIITKTHGVHGEVNVFPTTDDPKRFLNLTEVILSTDKGQQTLTIEKVRFFKSNVILKFQGYDTIESIEIYKGSPLLVPRSAAVPLQENEYFIADLIGLSVETESESDFGVLRDVLTTGANDVYVIDSPAHGEVLVPAIADCIREVDVENGRMKIHLLDGLL